jgi:hypothetical protein
MNNTLKNWGIATKKLMEKTPPISQCERWVGLKFCKYTKIQQFQEAHKAQMFDDVFILIQNMIIMEQVLHFH